MWFLRVPHDQQMKVWWSSKLSQLTGRPTPALVSGKVVFLRAFGFQVAPSGLGVIAGLTGPNRKAPAVMSSHCVMGGISAARWFRRIGQITTIDMKVPMHSSSLDLEIAGAIERLRREMGHLRSYLKSFEGRSPEAIEAHGRLWPEAASAMADLAALTAYAPPDSIERDTFYRGESRIAGIPMLSAYAVIKEENVWLADEQVGLNLANAVEAVGRAAGNLFGSLEVRDKILAFNDNLGIPNQVPGPNFTVQAGLLDFSPVSDLDASENNISRLGSLHPILLEQVKEAVEAFSGKNSFQNVWRALESYNTALNKEIGQVNFAQLAAYGILLENAETAAARKIEERVLPQMEDQQFAALRNVLDLHGTFILATKIGREMIADSERFNATDQEVENFKASASVVVEALGSSGIVKSEVNGFIKNAIDNVGEGSHPERAAALGVVVMSNVLVVTVSTAIGGALAGPIGAAVGLGLSAPLSTLNLEGIKRSRLGVSWSKIVQEFLDRGMNASDVEKFQRFVAENVHELKSIGESRRELRWLKRLLDREE